MDIEPEIALSYFCKHNEESEELIKLNNNINANFMNQNCETALILLSNSNQELALKLLNTCNL